MEKLYQHDVIGSLTFNPKVRCLEFETRSNFAQEGEWPSVLAEILNAQRARKLTGFLIDDREAKGALREEDRQAIGVWFSKMAEFGLRYVAMVVAKSAIAQMTNDGLAREQQDGPLTFSSFATPEEAQAWLAGKG
jgi:hypothetical protein